MAVHTLEPNDHTLHGYFSPDYAPALTVDPGDTVVFRTLDCWWSAGAYTGDDPLARPRVPQHRQGFGHALCGPVAVRGARAGMVLTVDIGQIVPGTYGATAGGGWPSTFNAHYGIEADATMLFWDLDPAAMTARNQLGHTVGLRPFMGVMGMPPASPGEHSTIPPRPHGGNLDCKELVPGTRLMLPIPVDGALFSVGDGHAAQGDGEVSGTAVECPMERVSLTFGLRDDFALTGPVARLADAWLTIGLGPTVDEAVFSALNAMFSLMQHLHGVSRPEAAALASVAVDVRVTQIVNQTVGAHAVLRDGVLGVATSSDLAGLTISDQPRH